MFIRKEISINNLDVFINKIILEFIHSRKVTIYNINSDRYQKYLNRLIDENRSKLIELFLENKNALNNLKINEFITQEFVKVYTDQQSMAVWSAKLVTFLSKFISKEIKLKIEEELSNLLNDSDLNKSIQSSKNKYVDIVISH